MPSKAGADACSWDPGDLGGCSVGDGWSPAIVSAWAEACITRAVTAWSQTTATKGFAASAGQPDAAASAC